MMDTNSVKSPKEMQNEECAAFQDLMAERIGAGDDLQSYSHMQTCELCQALWRDLQSIADAAKELMKVEIDPPNSDEMLKKIFSKIDSDRGGE